MGEFIRAEPIPFSNVTGSSVGEGTDPVSLAEYVNGQFDPTLSWDHLAWFREGWPGAIVLEGIQSVEDAVLAAEGGVDAIAVSKHGGRQLDGAPSPIDLVPVIAEHVGGRLEIICDGGVRRGSDIVKAMALGANACMVGRPYLYALGAAGEQGVDHVLRFFQDGLERTMALTGVRSVSDIGPDLVRRLV